MTEMLENDFIVPFTLTTRLRMVGGRCHMYDARSCADCIGNVPGKLWAGIRQ